MTPLPDSWTYSTIGVLAPEPDRDCDCGHLMCLRCGDERADDPGRDDYPADDQ